MSFTKISGFLWLKVAEISDEKSPSWITLSSTWLYFLPILISQQFRKINGLFKARSANSEIKSSINIAWHCTGILRKLYPHYFILKSLIQDLRVCSKSKIRTFTCPLADSSREDQNYLQMFWKEKMRKSPNH